MDDSKIMDENAGCTAILTIASADGHSLEIESGAAQLLDDAAALFLAHPPIWDVYQGLARGEIAFNNCTPSEVIVKLFADLGEPVVLADTAVVVLDGTYRYLQAAPEVMTYFELLINSTLSGDLPALHYDDPDDSSGSSMIH